MHINDTTSTANRENIILCIQRIVIVQFSLFKIVRRIDTSNKLDLISAAVIKKEPA